MRRGLSWIVLVGVVWRAGAEEVGKDGKAGVRMEAEGGVVLRALAAPLPDRGMASFDSAADGGVWGVSVTLVPGADAAAALSALVAAGASPVSVSLRREGARLDVTAPAGCGRAVVVAARALGASVAAVVPWSLPVPVNDESIWVGQSGDPVTRATPVFDHGLTGTGEVVAVYDTGLDPDMCFFTLAPGAAAVAQALVPPDIGVVDPSKKTIAYYVEPGATAYDNPRGHGTAVAGCALGDDFATLATPVSAGHDPADGMAPDARLLLLDGGGDFELSGIVGDLGPVYLQSYLAGARIQNHSWINPAVNVLSPYAVDIDRFAWRHEDMLFVNAAGNAARSSTDGTISDPATAKNVLAVGATSNGSQGARDLASFSSRGPAFDGRLKPELVAPGLGQHTAGGSGVVGDVDCGTLTYSGTSFSSPTVAGFAALTRQYHRQGFLPTGAASAQDETLPSAALVRATLIASAVPLAGLDPLTGQPVDPPPSMNQGYGRPLLDGALYFTGDARRTTVLDLGNGRGLGTGQTGGLSLEVGTSSEPLVVALVWTDPPVLPGTSPALVNDLDLVVTDPAGSVYRGNAWENGVSIPGGPADRLNSVEAVKVPVPLSGRWEVRVETGRPLGLPGLDRSERQGFALVLTYGGCAAAAPPAPGSVTATETASGFDLSWPAVPGALGYLVYRADGLASPGARDHGLLTPSPVPSTTYHDPDLQCGNTYSYQVRAWNGCSLGPPSPARSILRSLGSCTLAPDFAGISDARPDGACGRVRLEWAAAVSRCTCSLGVVYSVWASPVLPVDPSQPPVLACVSGTSATLDVGAGSGLIHYLVRAEDRVPGGTGICGGVQDSNLESRATVPLSPTVRPQLVDRFDTGRGSWQLTALVGPNAWDLVLEPFAWSPPQALRAVDFATQSDSVAEMVGRLPLTADTFVSFRHTHDTEGRYDGGVVELSIDRGPWTDAGPRLVQGRYTDWMLTGPSSTVIRPGFTGGSLGPMAESLVWLGDLAGSEFSLRFRMLSDASGAHLRWAIDDLQVFDRDCPASPGALVAAFTSTAPVCDGSDVAFDASATYGGLPAYDFRWDFGDGSAPGAGATVTHRYAIPGVYDVRLEVTDAAATTDSLTIPVTVIADQPAPDMGNVLLAWKMGQDAVVYWDEPPGPWGAIDVLGGGDLGDLRLVGQIAGGNSPWRYTHQGAVANLPALLFWRVRLRSACSDVPGPY